MCGIVCYVGSQNCSRIVIDGLSRLEYRGYDSAGIAVHSGTEIHISRQEGKLAGLEEKLRLSPLSGSTGIGHTRWATHGRPSENNAHPHRVGKIAVIHNGIFENHLELRASLEKEGCVFSSETDTEILAHLVSQAIVSAPSLKEAVRQSLGKVQGSYAVAVLSEDNPDELIVAKNASPLVIGIGEGEMFAASDVPAILKYTRKVMFMEDGELARLTREGAEIETMAGEAVTKPQKEITWSHIQAEKEGYKHFMLKEIYQQPTVIEDTLRGRVSIEGSGVATELMGFDDATARRIRRIVLLACGTSYHASMVGKYWLEKLAQVPTEVELASEYRAREPLVDPNDLVIPVSQSGETLDTMEAIKIAKAGAARILAISNVVDSAIPRSSDGTLYTHAGPEIGVASTKCFTAQLAALYMLAVHLGRRRNTLTKDQARELLENLMRVPKLMNEVLKKNDEIKKIAHSIAHLKDALFLGRNLSYPIALEGALKLKEISYVHAEGYAAGEMKHGPIALIDENMPVVVVMPNDESLKRIVGNVQEVMARGGKVIGVVSENEQESAGIEMERIVIPACPPEVSPLLSVLPLQLLAYHVADFKGTDVDQPRNLAKTVTVE
ncbi:MAG: glutamine--fructose-6-phosphate transaminase (isomerizing) [Deltaproteobacteria bacterium]|nr:glutamine--fructose-6-phosphate transaminase (isomerizing) [Deltaproteobacteria bacterium]MBN2672125.1 glutamine--fructose-6-phosphate transaminase (isomerizing) [Deltaproteobacteria bacterium]